VDPNSKNKKQIRRINVLESLKELGNDTARTFSDDLIKETGKDFAKQLFGNQFPLSEQNYSGELLRQEQVDIERVLNGQQEREDKLERQLGLEKQLRQEEQALFDKQSQELRLALHAITEEIKALASATPRLAEELQIAIFQAPVKPGIYHISFFQKLLEYIKGFRKKIEDASIWLHATNKRAAKKGFWAQYQKHGGRRLLSAEDYSQRSAG